MGINSMNKIQINLINSIIEQLTLRIISAQQDFELMQKQLGQLKSVINEPAEVPPKLLASNESIHQALKKIEKPSQLVRMKEVTQITGLSRSTIYKLMNDSLFPNSVKLGIRSVAWLRSDIIKWIESKYT